ncbi:MAG: polysaccharide deacetylase family protein [Desulfosarcinaceae bacterium]|nr:polysaccharide deacetylase family protein [Desulfosarcinaceae bacterium]
MNRTPAAIYRKPQRDIEQRLAATLARANTARRMQRPATVWFRADDIGVPGRQFYRMLALFAHHQVPLAPALVPTWLTRPRWEGLLAHGGAAAHLWGWHQHGWRHQNHETHGKKQEFGSARAPASLRADLERGRRRLESLLADAFLPVFTPPWNRCSQATLQELREMGFRAVSRSTGATPAAPAGLPDFTVNVDLHTRKAPRPDADWARLLAELETALTAGWCGIMLHHQRMNPAAFDFLDILLQHMKMQQHFRIVELKTLLEFPNLAETDPT